MDEATAERFGVKDKDIVSVVVDGERAVVFRNVLIACAMTSSSTCISIRTKPTQLLLPTAN